jgi:hypothetical protein
MNIETLKNACITSKGNRERKQIKNKSQTTQDKVEAM